MTTYDEIAACLDAEQLIYRRTDERIRLGFVTELYEAPDGDNSLELVISLQDEGELVRVLAPGAYYFPRKGSARKLAAVQRTLNQINWETKILHYEMDTEDGEIRLCIDFPLEDGKLTTPQLTRMLRLMPNVADQCHLGLRQAIDDGIAQPTEAELCRRLEQFAKDRP